ncbi:MAG: large subunit ribosomal protein [Patescibacteria group bacterium]|jgi:large subunit ribosomal protein L19|nr:large subunit ribosomal protein [Patescibacteria group bacterium]
MNNAVQALEVLKPEQISAGQVLRVHEKIQDLNAKGEARERIQVFEGLVLGVRGKGASKSFTIRKETDGFGVEKIFPLSSPNLSKIELVKAFKTRRARLSFVKGFGRRLKELVSKKTKTA